MSKVSPIQEMSGCHFKGIALTADCVSTFKMLEIRKRLAEQNDIAKVTGWFFPHLQSALFVILVETPFTCDAITKIKTCSLL